MKYVKNTIIQSLKHFLLILLQSVLYTKHLHDASYHLFILTKLNITHMFLNKYFLHDLYPYCLSGVGKNQYKLSMKAWVATGDSLLRPTELSRVRYWIFLVRNWNRWTCGMAFLYMVWTDDLIPEAQVFVKRSSSQVRSWGRWTLAAALSIMLLTFSSNFS